MGRRYMLKIHPIKCKDIPLLLNEAGVCTNLFFDRLQELKYRHGCHINFECMQTAGSGYYFDQHGNILRGTEGPTVRFDYRLETVTDKDTALHSIFF